MYYLIYKITNKVNDKFYIGAHKTKDKNDSYMGSSMLVKKAIQKYGINNFIKEIIYEASSIEEMYLKEKELVIIDRNISYNLKEGGIGGFDFINKNGLAGSGFLGKKHSINTRNKISEKLEGNIIWLGKTHKEESKKKMSESHQGKHDGKTNSQYGTMWINNGQISSKIHKTEPMPKGWMKGRLNGTKKYNE
jgi:group I intron endonuclease